MLSKYMLVYMKVQRNTKQGWITCFKISYFSIHNHFIANYSTWRCMSGVPLSKNIIAQLSAHLCRRHSGHTRPPSAAGVRGWPRWRRPPGNSRPPRPRRPPGHWRAPPTRHCVASSHALIIRMSLYSPVWGGCSPGWGWTPPSLAQQSAPPVGPGMSRGCHDVLERDSDMCHKCHALVVTRSLISQGKVVRDPADQYLMRGNN